MLEMERPPSFETSMALFAVAQGDMKADIAQIKVTMMRMNSDMEDIQRWQYRVQGALAVLTPITLAALPVSLIALLGR